MSRHLKTATIFLAALVFLANCSDRTARNPTFCTLRDEVFLALENHAVEWVEEFRSPARRNSAGARELLFSVPSGKEYSASAMLWDIWSDTSAPVIYVMFEWNRNELLGWAGYIYSPEHVPSYTKYNITSLSSDIYCYTRKTWAELVELTQTP